MKKIIAILMVALVGVVVLAGCSGKPSVSSFEMMTVDNTMQITAENAGTDSTAEADLSLEKDAKLTFDANALTEGKLQIALTLADGSEGPVIEVSAKGSVTADIPAGNYTAVVSVLETANGEATVTINEVE